MEEGDLAQNLIFLVHIYKLYSSTNIPADWAFYRISLSTLNPENPRLSIVRKKEKKKGKKLSILST